MKLPLVAVPAGATPEQVAAIVAALAVVEDERRRTVATSAADHEGLDAWVRAARMSGRRAGMARGPWRLAGRVSRRARA